MEQQGEAGSSTGPEATRAPVERPRLLGRLDRIPPGGIGLVIAPAGSGKSVLVDQWATSRPELRVATLVLTPAHEDAVLLATDLLSTLRAIHPKFALGLEGRVMSGGRALGAPFVDGLVEALAAQAPGTVLVLDDLQTVTSPTLAEDLQRLISTLPASARMVLATRWDPPLQMGRLRVGGRVVELRAEHLAFDEAESHTLVASLTGRMLPDRAVQRLVERTDGWAAGLQLAALSMVGSEDPERFVEQFAGSDRLVVEYLTEEVLDRQDEPTRSFLLATSVLPWLSAELCRAVTGRLDAADQLRLLAERSLFVVPLDRRDERFRYHHLFADLLRYELRSERPDDVATLHRRAAEWLRAHGEHADAIGQFLAADEPSAAFDIVLEIGQDHFERGRSATLVRWLTEIANGMDRPEVAVELNLLAAQVAADQPGPAFGTYRRLRRRSDLTPGDAAAAGAIFSCLGLDDLDPEEVLDVTAAVLEALPDIEPTDVPDFLGIGGYDSIELVASFMRAVALFHRGEPVPAGDLLEELNRLPGVRYPVWHVYVLGVGALTRAWTGHLNDARRLAAAALDAAAATGLADLEYVTHAYFAVALVALEQNRIDDAATALAESALRNQRRSDRSFFDIQRFLEARLAAARGDHAASSAILSTSSSRVIELPVLVDASTALEVSAHLGARDVVRARAALGAHKGPPPPVATIDVALACDDMREARRVLEGWEPVPGDVREAVERAVRAAAVETAAGDAEAAGRHLAEALAVAEIERLRRPFLDVAMIKPSLRRLARRGGGPFVQGILDASAARAAMRSDQRALVEPLTDRELEILRYLPGRLTNPQLAAELYISTNTVKSHLRLIYRKLGAENRDEAVLRATELGLL